MKHDFLKTGLIIAKAQNAADRLIAVCHQHITAPLTSHQRPVSGGPNRATQERKFHANMDNLPGRAGKPYSTPLEAMSLYPVPTGFDANFQAQMANNLCARFTAFVDSSTRQVLHQATEQQTYSSCLQREIRNTCWQTIGVPGAGHPFNSHRACVQIQSVDKPGLSSPLYLPATFGKKPTGKFTGKNQINKLIKKKGAHLSFSGRPQ